MNSHPPVLDRIAAALNLPSVDCFLEERALAHVNELDCLKLWHMIDTDAGRRQALRYLQSIVDAEKSRRNLGGSCSGMLEKCRGSAKVYGKGLSRPSIANEAKPHLCIVKNCQSRLIRSETIGSDGAIILVDPEE